MIDLSHTELRLLATFFIVFGVSYLIIKMFGWVNRKNREETKDLVDCPQKCGEKFVQNFDLIVVTCNKDRGHTDPHGHVITYEK